MVYTYWLPTTNRLCDKRLLIDASGIVPSLVLSTGDSAFDSEAWQNLCWRGIKRWKRRRSHIDGWSLRFPAYRVSEVPKFYQDAYPLYYFSFPVRSEARMCIFSSVLDGHYISKSKRNSNLSQRHAHIETISTLPDLSPFRTSSRTARGLILP